MEKVYVESGCVSSAMVLFEGRAGTESDHRSRLYFLITYLFKLHELSDIVIVYALK